MARIRITKIFSFEAAHLLQYHKGLCKNIHGHSYTLHVSVGGLPASGTGSARDGMVMDFSDLKRIVQKKILDDFDHALIVNSDCHGGIAEKLKELQLKIVQTPFEPTSENLIIYFAEQIKNSLPAQVDLMSMRLYETSTSYVEWFREEAKR